MAIAVEQVGKLERVPGRLPSLQEWNPNGLQNPAQTTAFFGMNRGIAGTLLTGETMCGVGEDQGEEVTSLGSWITSARFPVPRQLDVPVPLDWLPAGGTTDPDRPFPIPDGGPQLLVRDARDDFQFQPFGR